ncbi:MAG: amidohydrolase [Planctomycetia bacterium]
MRTVLVRIVFVFAVALLAAACAWIPTRVTADRIWFNGQILTMEGVEPAYVEALAVANGRIIAAGDLTSILSLRDSQTQVCDLGGRALLPGFIDPHSHIAAYTLGWGLPALQPPPVGSVRRIADIQRSLREYIQKEAIPPGQLVMGQGYDDSLLEEGRHPTRQELDAVSTEHPIIVIHASGHLLAANSAALAKVGYTRETQDPAGGLIRREPDGTPNGVVEEIAGMPFLALIEPDPLEKQLDKFEAVQRYYISLGVTTAQDGISMKGDLALMREAARRNRMLIDIHAYPRWDEYNAALAQRDADLLPVGERIGRFSVSGMKLTVDGSPQGKTAYLTQPYVVPPEGLSADYRGYATMTQTEMNAWFEFARDEKFQLIVHCNGDAAADQMIAAVRHAQTKPPFKDRRPVMIHAQMIRPDQVEAMAQLGIIPSFFTAHTYYWGDWHIAQTVGRERAFRMSPANTARKLGIPFTNHSDASVVPPNHLDVIWTAVNRLSRSGVVVGPDERIPVYSALQAVTIHAARQYFEEDQKGTLASGKRADLVVLSADPLAMDPLQIRTIRVLETIKDGATIYLNEKP